MTDDTRWYETTVTAVRPLSPTVREITLQPLAGAAPWSAGSHLRVLVEPPGAAPQVRSYSLVGLPRPGAPWRIAVKRLQPGRGGSAWMHTLQAGQTLRVQPPDSHFGLPLAAPQLLLVAGGIGITPLVGMALQLAARGTPFRLCYAARGSEELVYADDLRAALGARLATFDSRVGKRLDLAAEIAALSPGAHLLVCGPLPMLRSAREAWAAAGRPAERLAFETYGSGGHAAAEPFWVSVPRHGLRFEVPAGRSLLDALADHGVELLADCRRGECGLCAVDVMAVHGRIDHRDVFFAPDEQAEGRRLCACVSRVCSTPGSGGAGVVLDSPFRPDNLPSPMTAATAEETSR